jgi:hypothetical protein
VGENERPDDEEEDGGAEGQADGGDVQVAVRQHQGCLLQSRRIEPRIQQAA